MDIYQGKKWAKLLEEDEDSEKAIIAVAVDDSEGTNLENKGEEMEEHEALKDQESGTRDDDDRKVNEKETPIEGIGYDKEQIEIISDLGICTQIDHFSISKVSKSARYIKYYMTKIMKSITIHL